MFVEMPITGELNSRVNASTGGRLRRSLKTDIDDATANQLSEAFRSHHNGLQNEKGN